jgi:hypothetical protein
VAERAGTPLQRFVLPIALFLAAVAISVALQWAGGAYGAEFGSTYPDEAPHYINGLLFERFLASGLGTSPLAFARDFFLHYPKVSVGHWPPLFYLLEATWMLVAGESKAAALILSAAITAALAALIGCIAARRHGVYAGIFASLVFVLLPPIRASTAAVMVDVGIALLDLIAALLYLRYLRRPDWRSAAWFGIAASFAVLTKGNGLALGLLPPFAIAMTRRFELLTRGSFWLPLGIVLVLCGPWTLLTLRLVSDGFVYSPGPTYTALAVRAATHGLLDMVGGFGLLLAGVGVAGAVRVSATPTTVAYRGVLAALATAVIVFQVTIPADIEDRYLIPAIPPLLLLALAGLEDVGSMVGRRWPRPVQGVTVVLVALVTLIPLIPDMLRVPQKPRLGMAEAAALVVADDGGEPSPTVLIAADGRGEGAFVVELARHDPAQRFLVARASKLLSADRFMGGAYVARFTDPADLASELDRLGIRYVVIDTSRYSRRLPHVPLLERAAALREWEEVGDFPRRAFDGETLVYRLHGVRALGLAPTAAAGCTWEPAAGDPASPKTGLPQLGKPFTTCP